MNKNIIVGAVVSVCVIGSVLFFYFHKQIVGEKATLPTYFTYTQEELNGLNKESSEQIIDFDDIKRFDDIAYQLISKNTQNQSFSEATSKVYAYLAMAERDFAFLSHNASGEFAGSFDSLAKKTLCMFFPSDCDAILVRDVPDAYSNEIEKIIFLRIRERMNAEMPMLTDYELKTGDEYWNGPQPSVGRKVGHNAGWFISSGEQFRLPPPPAYDSTEFKEQLETTIQLLKDASQKEKLATVSWAGGPGTNTMPGHMLEFGTNYLLGKNITLTEFLFMRSVLAATVADAETAAFDSKYTYQVKRPFMMDSTIKTIMPTPNHPSYPSGHSTLSAAGVQVLIHFFPEDTELLEAVAEEAGMSRVWGGIHYMMDHENGKALGKKVGEEAVKKTPALVP